jgi:hypothetical protein
VVDFAKLEVHPPSFDTGSAERVPSLHDNGRPNRDRGWGPRRLGPSKGTRGRQIVPGFDKWPQTEVFTRGLARRTLDVPQCGAP